MVTKKADSSTKIKRRSLLKLGAASCAATLVSNSFDQLFSRTEAQAASPNGESLDEYMYTICTNNCGSSCILKAYVKDDKIMRIEADDRIQDNWEQGIFQVRPCPRGRSMRRHMYAGNRLKYPLKRVGKRGEGKFERISWDEAYTIFSEKLRHCIDNYGNSAIMSIYASGVSTGALTRREAAWRFFNTLGGLTLGSLDYSSAQNQVGLSYLYGVGGYCGESVSHIADTKLAVFFGANIIETRMSGGGQQYELLEAKKKNDTKIIVIDPRLSDTCVAVADEWIPIRPGTDAALASALAYVLISEGLVDNEFLRNATIGFDSSSMPEGSEANSSYSDYILGTGYDKVAKTPSWAASITGIPAARIIQLAREIGQAKPCYITQGWGVQRQAAGEMTVMSIAALACLTGNIGIRGGGSGDYNSYYPFPGPRLPIGENKVKVSFPTYLWLQAVENGKNMTQVNDGVRGAERFPSDIKFIWNYAGNTLINQHSNINHTKSVLADETKCETIVVMDTHMTASAEWADLILPSAMYPEQTDIQSPSYAMDTDWLVVTGAVKPYFESKSVFDVMCELAKRMGTEQEYTEGRSREEWIEFLYQTKCRPIWPELPATAAEARKAGPQYRAKSRDFPIPFADFRKNPDQHPLKTPSGKVELYSQALYNLSQQRKLSERLGDRIPPTPQYVATWDGFEDHETKKTYPLQLIGHHYKGRTHSHYATVDWLLEVSPQNLWMNPLDAKSRGLRHGDWVKVWNNRGVVKVQLKVTRRIMPGVVSLPQGAWHKADANNVDVGGCVNTLTLYQASPIARGNPQHTNLVEVEKL